MEYVDGIELAWKKYAEACTCHNEVLGQLALSLIPRQREELPLRNELSDQPQDVHRDNSASCNRTTTQETPWPRSTPLT